MLTDYIRPDLEDDKYRKTTLHTPVHWLLRF
jgi:hypothetical protein